MNPRELNELAMRLIPDLYTWAANDRVVVQESAMRGRVADVKIVGDRCEIDAVTEFIVPSRDQTYSWFLQEYLGKKGHNLRELNRGSNLYYNVLFGEAVGSKAKQAGCRVEEVHIHSSLVDNVGTEHVHIRCRKKLPCGLALQATGEIIEASKMLSAKKHYFTEGIRDKLERVLEEA